MAAFFRRLVSPDRAALLLAVVFFVGVSYGKDGGGGGGRKGLEGEPERMGGGGCSRDYIDVFQAPSGRLPNGIPTYTVQVLNTCLPAQGCGDAGGGIGQVHLSCGWFSSARTINPAVFRRLAHDDCLVNDGKPIPTGGAVSFEYANTFPYKLAVASVACAPAEAA